jgi:protein TonB
MNACRSAPAVLLFLIASSTRAAPGAQEQSAPPAAQTSQQPVAHPARIRVGPGVAASQLIHIVQPQFHTDAKLASTKVVLHALIDFDGTVKSVEVVNGDPELGRAAVDAVKQWRYRPTKLNDQPVQVDTTIVVLIDFDRNGNLKPQPNSPKS